ncbi:MAG: hypothetical protein R2794_01360 [Chitinophagales bacterium]
MKKGIILITCLCVSVYLHAQFESGSFSIQAGFDGAIHGTYAESKFNGAVIDHDSSAAATSMFASSIQYHILPWLSAGLGFDYGAYIEDPEDAEANGNRISTFCVDARVYAVNHEHFNLYFGVQGGATFLKIDRLYVLFPPVSSEFMYHYSGSHFGAFTGFNWYLFKQVGLFTQIHYSNHGFDLKRYTINGTEQDLGQSEVTLDTFGVGIRLGLAIAFF